MKRHHIAVAATGAVALVIAGGTAAFGHVEPEPTEIPPGVAATVAFSAEEECPTPGTTGMLFEIPTGITDLLPVEKEGWTTAAGDDTVGFTRDDPAADDLTFQLAFTAPAAEGLIDFPVVQQCGDGSEVRWIEVQQEGQPEPELPAPQVAIVEGAPPATTVVPVTTIAPTTTAAPETTPVPATTAAPETTPAPTTTAAPETTVAAETTVAETTTTVAIETTVEPTTTIVDTEEDDDSNAGLIFGLIALAVALAGAAAYFLSRRSKAGPGAGAAAGAAAATGADGIPPGAAAATQVLPVTDPTGVTPADAPLPPIVPAGEPPAPLPPPPGEPPAPPAPPGPPEPPAPSGPAT